MERMRYERAKKRVKAISGFYRHLAVYLVVNVSLIAVQYFSLDPGERFFQFATFSTPFFWGIGLAFHALGVFGPNIFFGDNWEQKKINELMEKDKTRKWE